MLNPTTLLPRLVLPLVVFLAWTPVARAWTWPVRGAVLRPFAYDEAHPYASGQHRGIDIGAEAAGESVVAPASGTVSFAGTVPTNGKTVTIETPDGYSVTLTHLGTILVAKGETVAERDPVGTVGPSGTAEVEGPYVHLGVRVAADPDGYVDPLSLLPPVPEDVPAPSDPPASQPTASTGSSAATSQPPSAPAPSTPVPVTRGTTVGPSVRSRSHHARVKAQRPRAEARAQRPASHAARDPEHVRRRARTSQERVSLPTTSSQRPVVETAVPHAPTGLDAGHELRPSGRDAGRLWASQRETPAVPLPLICNGAPALVALAAAFAAARRRRRDWSAHVGAQILQLPQTARGRQERHAA